MPGWSAKSALAAPSMSLSTVMLCAEGNREARMSLSMGDFSGVQPAP